MCGVAVVVQLGRYGVTDMVIANDWLYTAGANGTVRAFPIGW